MCCYALLPVEHLVHAVGVQDKIDQAQRIALQKGFHDRYVLFAVAVDIIALVFGLDDELSAEAE